VSRRLRSAARAGFLAALLLLAPAWAIEASAQGSAEAGMGAVWQSYRFDAADEVGVEEISLLTVPLAFSARSGGGTAFDIRGAWAEGTLVRTGGSSRTIAGVTDLEVSLTQTFGVDAVVLGLVGAIPTGKSTHSAEEADVAAAIAADLLPFRVSSWGSGGGIGGSVAVARRMGDVGLGASVGYIVAGEFEPRVGEPVAFQPGNLLRAAAVVDRNIGGASKLALRLGFQRYGEDALEGTNLFRSGNRYEAIGSYAFPAGSQSSAIVYAGALHRDRGSYLTGVEEAPSQDLLVAGGALRAPAGGGVLTPSADLRVYRRSDGVGQGYIGGVGISMEWPVGGATLIPSARARLGSIDVREGSSSGVTGFEGGMTIRFGRVRR
jgi:hypothetical protein